MPAEEACSWSPQSLNVPVSSGLQRRYRSHCWDCTPSTVFGVPSALTDIECGAGRGKLPEEQWSRTRIRRQRVRLTREYTCESRTRRSRRIAGGRPRLGDYEKQSDQARSCRFRLFVAHDVF